MKRRLGIVFFIIVALLLGSGARRGIGAAAGQGAAPALAIDQDDVGGVVTGPRGPEAGVWVIAETSDFDTRFARIVVTDNEGRYVVPDLPRASYQVWVRGYGLVDSNKVTATPGRRLDLRAIEAPNAAAAAQYYPAAWWASLLEAPPASAFPIGGIQSQAEWVRLIKADWIRQQYGLKPMRELHPGNPTFSALGLRTTLDVLNYMRNAGQYVEFGGFANFDRLGEVGLPIYARWIDAIRAGAVPEAPPRPRGLERNIVVTTWDAGNFTAFSHDIVVSDKRDPTVNANGRVFFGDWHNDSFTIVNPEGNSDTTIPVPSIDDRFSLQPFTRQSGWANPSPTWGDEVIIQDRVASGSLAMDQRGRIWLSARVTGEAPDFCRPDSGNPFAGIDPTTSGSKGLAVYDPATGKWELIPTCYGSNHPTFAVDGTNKVFIQGGNSRFQWVDTDIWDKTHDAEAAQGWCRLFYDTDGDGMPNLNAPIDGAPYGPQQSLRDGSIWGTVQTVPGRIIRLTLGANPPATCVGEAYNVPAAGSFSRGVDVDSNGVVWTGLAGSGHLASFDRSKCRGPLTGPEAMTGNHCPEGWTLYATPGPRIRNSPFSADFHYYNFIDKYNVIGLGADTPLVNGTNSDSLMALDPATREWVTFRLPYPVGSLYTRNMSVRVDDPAAGWKGRGVWAANDTRAVWHGERGRQSLGLVAKFQLRPDPLAH
jgi:streptogramin lyase